MPFPTLFAFPIITILYTLYFHRLFGPFLRIHKLKSNHRSLTILIFIWIPNSHIEEINLIILILKMYHITPNHSSWTTRSNLRLLHNRIVVSSFLHNLGPPSIQSFVLLSSREIM